VNIIFASIFSVIYRLSSSLLFNQRKVQASEGSFLSKEHIYLKPMSLSANDVLDLLGIIQDKRVIYCMRIYKQLFLRG
jgi:hypothetical protein